MDHIRDFKVVTTTRRRRDLITNPALFFQKPVGCSAAARVVWALDTWHAVALDPCITQ